MDKIIRQWSSLDYTPSKAGIKIAANLAVGGYLTNLPFMKLNIDFDEAGIDKQNMQKLTSIIDKKVVLSGVLGDWSCVIDSLHCEELEIEDNDIAERTQTQIHVKKVKLVDVRDKVQSS